MLEESKRLYENDGVFPSYMIDKIVQKLKAFKDKNLSEKMFENADALKNIVKENLHCG